MFEIKNENENGAKTGANCVLLVGHVFHIYNTHEARIIS